MSKGRIDLCKDAQEFLFYSYFGKSWDELKSSRVDALYFCFRCAYGDFKRTMSFRENVADFPKKVFFEGKNYDYYVEHKKDVWLGSMLGNLLENGNIEDDFKERHEKTCDRIVKIASTSSKFSYGQAQKWVNMTLKYMFMMGLYDDKSAGTKEVLHVPIDRYILIAVLNEKKREKIFGSQSDLINPVATNFNFANSEGALHFTIDEEGKVNEDSKLCKVGEKNAAYVSWSNIEWYKNYEKIQDMIKKCIPDGMAPLEWENKVWLKASKYLK